MVSLKFNFLHALLHKQVYHFPTSHYVNPLRCKSRSFGCYFQAPTNCTPQQHIRVESSKIHWCFDLPRRRLSRLAGLQGVHSKAWYHAQLSAFLFRPNHELRLLARELLWNMEGTPDAKSGSNEPAIGQSRSPRHANGSCVAIHIRRTDKHTEDHRVAQRKFEDFAQTFKAWGYWAFSGSQPHLEAFLGSEDKVGPFDALFEHVFTVHLGSRAAPLTQVALAVLSPCVCRQPLKSCHPCCAHFVHTGSLHDIL